jgi:hypothetical protein
MLVGDMLRLLDERGIALRPDEKGEIVILPEASERLSSVHQSILRHHARKIARILRENEAWLRTDAGMCPPSPQGGGSRSRVSVPNGGDHP